MVSVVAGCGRRRLYKTEGAEPYFPLFSVPFLHSGDAGLESRRWEAAGMKVAAGGGHKGEHHVGKKSELAFGVKAISFYFG